MPELDSELIAALAAIRERGAIGESSLEAAIAHANQFVALIPESATTLVDLGSGGGLPGLVIAWRRPDLSVTLLERRTRRADLLRRAVGSLGLEAVAVMDVDVAVLAKQLPRHFSVVTARSFAAPEVTARWAGALAAPGASVLVSEPPNGDPRDRWPADLLEQVGLVDLGSPQHVRRFQRLP